MIIADSEFGTVPWSLIVRIFHPYVRGLVEETTPFLRGSGILQEDAVMCAETVYLIVTDLVRSSAYAMQVFKLIFAFKFCCTWCHPADKRLQLLLYSTAACHKPHINSKR
jgi:hypothetical protein